jgi:hypothetical protein
MTDEITPTDEQRAMARAIAEEAESRTPEGRRRADFQEINEVIRGGLDSRREGERGAFEKLFKRPMPKPTLGEETTTPSMNDLLRVARSRTNPHTRPTPRRSSQTHALRQRRPAPMPTGWPRPRDQDSRIWACGRDGHLAEAVGANRGGFRTPLIGLAQE